MSHENRPTLVSLAMRLLPLVVLLGLGGVLVALTGGPRHAFEQITAHRDWLEVAVARQGMVAPLAYVLCYIGLMLLLWIPAWMVTVVGGFLFGFWFGALYAVIGATLGATLVFLLGRWGLGGLVRQAGPYVQRFEAGFRADALSYMIGLRLVPIVPFAAVNVVPAALGVSIKIFILGTVLGIIPGTLIYAGLGSGLRDAAADGASVSGSTLLRPGLLFPLLGLAALAMAPVIWRRWLRP